MAIAWIQDQFITLTAGPTVAKAFDSNVTAGSMLLCAVRLDNLTDTPTAADNINGAWTAHNVVQRGDTSDFIFSFPGSASGAITITISNGVNVQAISFVILEYGGLATSSAFDKSASASGVASSAADSGNTATTTLADELIFGAMFPSFTETLTVGSGFAARRSSTSARVHTEEKIVSATGAYKADGTWSGNNDWSALCATYKASGAAPDRPTGLPFVMSEQYAEIMAYDWTPPYNER